MKEKVAQNVRKGLQGSALPMAEEGDAHFLVATKVLETSFFVQLMEVGSDATLRDAINQLLGVLICARVMVEVEGVKLRVATNQHSHPPNFA